MERLRMRRSGVKAGVCAAGLLGWGLLAEPLARAETGTSGELSDAPAPVPAPAAIELPETSELPGVVIFPARGGGPHPITVLLHGMCGDAARACSHFADQVTQSSNLICPRASQRCTGGGASWPERGVSEAVEAAVARAKTALSEPLDETRGRTLIGYSMGAFRALRIAQGGAGKYPRVMLIGAKISLDQAQLAQNGVFRVLLCAGNRDMMHDHMQRETERAQRAGLQARFLDLGPVGHTFTPSFARYLPQALSWLELSKP